MTEPPDLFKNWLPSRFKDKAPYVVKDDERNVELWVVGDRQPITPVGHTAVAGWREPFPAAPSGFDEIPLAARYVDRAAPPARLELADIGDELGSAVQAIEKLTVDAVDVPAKPAEGGRKIPARLPARLRGARGSARILLLSSFAHRTSPMVLGSEGTHESASSRRAARNR